MEDGGASVAQRVVGTLLVRGRVRVRVRVRAGLGFGFRIGLRSSAAQCAVGTLLPGALGDDEGVRDVR